MFVAENLWCFKLIKSLGNEYLACVFENCEVSKFAFKSLKVEILREIHKLSKDQEKWNFNGVKNRTT